MSNARGSARGGGGGGMGTFGFDSYIIMNHTRRPVSGYESSLLLPYFSFLLIFAQFAAKIPLLYYTVLLLSEWVSEIQTKSEFGELTEWQQCLPGRVVAAEDLRTVCASS